MQWLLLVSPQNIYMANPTIQIESRLPIPGRRMSSEISGHSDGAARSTHCLRSSLCWCALVDGAVRTSTWGLLEAGMGACRPCERQSAVQYGDNDRAVQKFRRQSTTQLRPVRKAALQRETLLKHDGR